MSCPTLTRRATAPVVVEHAPASVARVDAPAPAAPRTPLQRGLRDLVDGDTPLLQLVRFAATGGLSTAVQVLLFALLAPVGALLANGIAWVVSTALANELHRRRTFHAEDNVGWFAAQWEGGGLSLVGLGLTTGALAALAVAVPTAGVTTQVVLVLGVNATVGLVRFLALRWAFTTRPAQA